MTFPATRFTHAFTITAGMWFVAIVATDSVGRCAALLVRAPRRHASLFWGHRALFFGQA